MDADGTDQRRLTDDAVQDGAASFSPDGSALVFAKAVGGADLEVMVMDLEGDILARLTRNRFTDQAPYWLVQPTS